MNYDVIVIGAGAAGLMAAIEAGRRGRRTLIIEHTAKIGEKIRISGGGRCNFTNINAASQNYISQNPHFAKSALASYTQQDFIKLVESYGIAYHEKTLGQLFCDGSSKQIVGMLVDLCHRHGVEIKLNCSVTALRKDENFKLSTTTDTFQSQSVVIACGGLSIPQIGASDFGYRVAKKFGLKILPTRPALVPLTVTQPLSQLSGVSNMAVVSYNKAKFRENILFTHRGLSGPAILQISSYLPNFDNQEIIINMVPDLDLREKFSADKNSKQSLANYLKNLLPNRFIEHIADAPHFHKALTDLKKDTLNEVAAALNAYKIKISGSEGYQKAEVTVGGVDTDELSSKTMECKKVPGLYFIGEVVDVTGWLGGYNFQWAWSSGAAAGRHC